MAKLAERKLNSYVRTYVIEVLRLARPRFKDTVGRTKQIIVTNGSHERSPAQIVHMLQLEQAWGAMHNSSQAASDATGRFAIRRLTVLSFAASTAACQQYSTAAWERLMTRFCHLRSQKQGGAFFGGMIVKSRHIK